MPEKKIRICGVTNTAAVKRYALEMIQQTRPRFAQVSKEFTDRVEANTRAFIRSECHRQPSIGVTIK